MSYTSKFKIYSVLLIQSLFTLHIITSFLSRNKFQREIFCLGNWGIITILFLFWGVFSWYIITRKVISYYNVFLSIALIFHFGQSWVEVLTLDSIQYTNLNVFFSVGKINVAYYYSFVAIVIFHTMALISGYIIIVRNKNKQTVNTIQDKAKLPNYIKSFSLLLFTISFIAKFQIDIKYALIAIERGYLAIFEGIQMSRYWKYLFIINGFYFPSVYLLLFVYKKSKQIFNTILIFVVLYSLAYGLIIGNRGAAFMFIIAVLMYRHTIYKKFSINEALGILVFGMVLLSVSSFISITRVVAHGSLSFESFIEALRGSNLILSSMAEFGTTITTLLVAMKYIPGQYPFAGGITYLASAVVILPDVLGVFSWLQPFISFSGMLTKLHTGLGGSFIAEAYFNYGNNGFYIMSITGVIIGIFATKLDCATEKSKNSLSYVWASLLFFSSLMYIRDQLYSITSGLLQYMIYPWILYYIYKSVIRRFYRPNKVDDGKYKESLK